MGRYVMGRAAPQFAIACVALLSLSRMSALTVPDWLWVVTSAAWALVGNMDRPARPSVHQQQGS